MYLGSLINGLTVRTAVSFSIEVVFLFKIPPFLFEQIIGAVARKSLRLSGRGRINHSVGKITTMISTDASRLDRFSGFGHK